MELIWNEIAAPRLILLEKPQVLLEGAIPLPAGKDAAELIDYTAEAQLDSCRAETAKLSIDGRLTVRLIAADSAGEVFHLRIALFAYAYRRGDRAGHGGRGASRAFRADGAPCAGRKAHAIRRAGSRLRGDLRRACQSAFAGQRRCRYGDPNR